MHVTGTSPAPEPQAIPAAPDHPAPAGPAPGNGRHARRFGLPVATALVMGNIIGGGIFLLPASVAPFGTISLLAFGVSMTGAVVVTVTSRRRWMVRHDARDGPRPRRRLRR
ncbi:Amino acid permease OS=Streptomyces tendae OX=1932 GN=GUR47_01450 PE=4 SV=1 [Streptomyces tendae]